MLFCMVIRNNNPNNKKMRDSAVCTPFWLYDGFVWIIYIWSQCFCDTGLGVVRDDINESFWP